MFDAGVLVISQEIELASGVFRFDNWGVLSKDGKPERLALHRLLQLYRDFEIDITFPIVGHLFLDSCSGSHPVSPTPDWYDEDPGTSYKEAPLWYAPDIIEVILKDQRNHEIASHSFSHVSFHKCSPQVAEFELEACKEVTDKFDITLRSFVFPLNRVGHVNLLKKFGYFTYRAVLDDAPVISERSHKSAYWMALRILEKLPEIVSKSIIRGTQYLHLLFNVHPIKVSHQFEMLRVLW